MIDAVVCFLRNKKTKKVLVLKTKTINEWEFPKGKKEVGEDIAAGVKREVWEETGIRLDKVKYITSHKTENFNWFFFSAETNVESVTLGHEHSDWKWIDVKEIRKLPLAAEVDYIINYLKL